MKSKTSKGNMPKVRKSKSLKVGYCMKLAGIGLFKNRVMSLTSIFVLFSCLIILGSFFLVMQNIDYNLEKIDGFNKVVLFVDKKATAFETAEIKDQLLTISSVEEVEFISKEVALEEQVSQYSEAEFLMQSYKENNPLKDSYVITYKPGTNVQTLIMNIENTVSESLISKLSANVELANQIQNIKNAISIVFTWLLVLMLLVSLLLIMNTIKLSVFSRRHEIALMRYIGATNAFISVPFLIEGLAIGLASAVIAYPVQFLINKYFILGLVDQFKIISVMPFGEVSRILAIGFAVIGICTGFLGSYISLKRYNQENS